MSDNPQQDKQVYSISDRAFWWIRFWTAVLVVAGMALAGARWGFTRASTDEVDAIERDLNARKEDKLDAEKARAKLEKKIDQQTAVIGNVRDNVIIMMERQRLEPKPLPPALPEPGP